MRYLVNYMINISYYNIFKRLIDFTMALVALTILFIPMLVIAAIVKITSKGPVFFKQKRVGINGTIFCIFKFRSMLEDAEDMLKTLRCKNERDGPVFKMKNDPRVTPVGKFIRKYCLDELPQLINILIGDMSFVGPRPALLSEVEEYQPWQKERLKSLPGLTCFWQISKNNMSFDEWIKSDIKYIESQSIFLDICLILKTFPVFIRGHE